MGREWGEDGEGEVSLRATWDQGGRDRTTQEEGFQVSTVRRGSKDRGDWQKELTRKLARGAKGEPRHDLALLSICVYDNCMNATNKRIVFRL
jgi:hypothetical protein